MLRGSVSQIRAAIRFISNPAFLAPALSFDCRTSLQSIHQPYKEPGLKNETGTCHASSTLIVVHVVGEEDHRPATATVESAKRECDCDLWLLPRIGPHPSPRGLQNQKGQ